MFYLCLKQVTVAYHKDQSPNKLNLGVGAYRTEVCLLVSLLLLLDHLFIIELDT